ncbi:MAG: hypothetical protein QOH07_3025 [Mycobacterium sp.]|nr:hypothetical protein [Mycobacterium sp.]
MLDSPDATVGRECVPLTGQHLHVVSSHLVEEQVGDAVPDDRPRDDGIIVCW